MPRAAMARGKNTVNGDGDGEEGSDDEDDDPKHTCLKIFLDNPLHADAR